MKLVLTILFIVFSTAGFSKECLIKAPKLIVWNKTHTPTKPSSALTFENCSSKFEEKAISVINDFSGTVSSRILATETNNKNFKLSNEFKIQTLADFLNENIRLPKEWKLINAKPTAGTKGLLIKNTNESLSVECALCQNTGEKTIKLELANAVNNRYKNFWIKAEVAVKTQALVSEANLKVDNSPLSPRQFKLKTLYSSKPEKFFLSKDKIVFYKVNKPINKGEMLIYSDLTPVNLVQMGRPVSVILKSKALQLEGSAIATQSGKLGERIRLKNKRTNKVIIGKIIGFNKAEVEL
ncbi:MAG: flagellar basal body P-ring formation chaperone FlgA [Halobacteriovoraceae bacterium]|nr:flagellar basal body P-ring formation chaperone FlgA [Halobacteriovoraceae bacterium]